MATRQSAGLGSPDAISVLVADDSPVLRDALAVLITHERGLELVAAVGDASEAIEVCAREQPDVALIDVRMPGGGASAARGIRRRAPDTKVVVLSGRDDRATVLQMLEAGAVGYLVKGESVDTITDAIRRAGLGQGSLSVEVTGEVINELAGELAGRRRAEQRRGVRERRIRRVLEEPDRLSVVFQPIFLLNGQAVGAEALARFRGSPKRGPDVWFAEAEEVGLREELELLAVRAALGQLPKLPAGLFLSVNVSPETLDTPAFRDLLAAEDGSRIVVEITEHARIEDYGRVNRAVDQLRARGVRLAIDDAGAGFASLRHILLLEPDIIKLDRALIGGIDHDRSQQALAAGLISFSDRIDVTIIAEGIERSAEVGMLTSLGVRQGQGYFLARPGPPLAV